MEFLGNFWEFFRICLEESFGGIFWEDFFGKIFWEDFLGGFFGRMFLGDIFGRIFWEEFFGRNYLVEIKKELMFFQDFEGDFVSMEGRENLDP